MRSVLLILAVVAFACGAAAAQEETVWVTMEQGIFEDLVETQGLLPPTLSPRKADAVRAGVVVTELRVLDLPRIAEFIHHSRRRCGGFIVHGSRAAALEVLHAGQRVDYKALPVAFQIDQQTLVQQLLPELLKPNLLNTIQQLSTTFNNRYYQGTEGELAALWVRDLWQGYAAGRSDITVETFAHSTWDQSSVILTIEGSTLPSEVIVLGGHLDSIQSGANNSNPATLAPGADDNASGIAALSEVIRVLAQNGFTPDRTVKFMGYSAEEVGLRGSGEIADAFVSAGTNVVGVMQLDMTGFNGSLEDIVLVEDNTNAELNAFVGSLVDTYQPTLQRTESTCGYACSDHASWHQRGFPASFPFEARLGQHNSTIHSTGDTLAFLGNSADHAVKFAQLALAFAVETSVSGSAPPPPPPPPTGCPAGSIDFNALALTSYSNQNSTNSTAVEDGGDTLRLTGNTWVRSTQVYTVTANTVVDFEFASGVQGEIHALGFDDNDTLNDAGRHFQFWGSQNWTGTGKIDWTPKYSGGGTFQSYSIPVGQSYTGSMRLVFTNDQDASPSSQEGRFRCVRIYEAGSPPPPPPPTGCDVEEDFETGGGGWVASGSCVTGAFVRGTPDQVISSGVTTQPAGAHNGSNALFTAPNTGGAGTEDVDGGECVVTSPVYNVTQASTVAAWYFYGQRTAGNDSGDYFFLEMSKNGGPWSTVVALGDVSTNAVWTEGTGSAAVGDSVQLRVRVSDGTANGDLVEGGIDSVSICP
jgi:hypothetical protein